MNLPMRAVRLLVVCGLIGLVTAFHHSIGLTNATTVALSLLLVVLAVATIWGLGESIVASLVAAACFNYFFLPPIGTWTIADPENWVALFTFLVVSIVSSQLSERARRKAREAIEHQREKARLSELTQRAEMVRQSEEFKSTLLDALAHELKTPLHTPNLTAHEINLVHRLWLRFSEQVAPQELHHHDVVHFALNELVKELEDGRKQEVLERLKQHLEENLTRRAQARRPPA